MDFFEKSFLSKKSACLQNQGFFRLQTSLVCNLKKPCLFCKEALFFLSKKVKG